MPRSLHAWIPFAAFALAACEANVNIEPPTDDPRTGPGTDVDTGPPPPPQYLLPGGVFTQDGAVVYVDVTATIDESVSVDLEEALSLGVGIPAFGVNPFAPGTFLIGRSDEPSVERWRVSEKGVFSQDEAFSMANLGMQNATGVRNPLHFVSATEAYFFDVLTFQIVPFDPSKMILAGPPISLDGLMEGDLVVRGNIVHWDGERFILSVRYFREDGTSPPLGRVVFFDPSTGTVTYATEEVCGNLASSILSEDGAVYFASHTSQAVLYSGGFAGDPASKPCMVRIQDGASGFDDDWYLDLGAVVGQPAGFVFPGSGTTAYVLAFDDETTPVTPENVTLLTSLGIWNYFAVDLSAAEPSAMPVLDLPPSSAFGAAFIVEEGTPRVEIPMLGVVADDFSTTTYFDITDPSAFAERFTVPGFGLGAIRIR
ncbi:MAG: hypothetical protein AAGA48_09380 [Myxococcota bacterium]